MNRGAIILCGGKSSRMGHDKASMSFGAEAMLSRVVGLVSEVVPAESIVCVAADHQTLPPLPNGVRIARDVLPDCGPLAGLAAGLHAMPAGIDAAFVCGCDMPLLLHAFVESMFAVLGEHQISAAFDGERLHPLGAVYRPDVLPKAEALLAAGERSLVALLTACDTYRVPVDQLREVDPELQSLAACNSADEYAQALRRAFPTG
jgi:molybdopterin-guanine dinucleotide biosynthesis protein A